MSPIRRVSATCAIVLAGLLLAAALALPARAQLNILDSATKALGNIDTGGATQGGLTDGQIADGLLEALKVGTKRVVDHVGAADGYNLDPDIHIPLPDSLQPVQKVLKRIGMSTLADDLELRLNRAAEAAAPEARDVFWQAISDMTLDDARRLYDGPDDAATQYFRKTMSPELAQRLRPIIEDSMAEVGAVRSYDTMMSRYEAVPLVPDVKANLTDYVVEKAMDGIFHYVAKEEAAIRNNPAARTTELLKTVFGSS